MNEALEPLLSPACHLSFACVGYLDLPKNVSSRVDGAGEGSELHCEGSVPNDGRLNGFVPGSSAPAAFNAASFAAHMTRAQRGASHAAHAPAGSAGASPKAGAPAPQAFVNGSAKRSVQLAASKALLCLFEHACLEMLECTQEIGHMQSVAISQLPLIP